MRASRFKAALFAVLVAIAAFLAGFVWFASTLPRAIPGDIAKADAIVVLTGDARRIDQAMALFERVKRNKGARLLISGVNATTTANALKKQYKIDAAMLACCVDIDRVARDTIGNAVQSARWVKRHGFTSLILATSAYHMPRAMAEFTHALPGVRLIRYPLSTPKVHLDRWWAYRGTTRLLFSEYGKYLLARIRIALNLPPRGTPWAAPAAQNG